MATLCKFDFSSGQAKPGRRKNVPEDEAAVQDANMEGQSRKEKGLETGTSPKNKSRVQTC